VSAGSTHGLAVLGDGTVWSWGADRHLVQLRPVQVSGLAGMTQVAAGDGDSFAVSANTGVVTSWGSNADGKLGDGTTTDRFTPQAIALDGVVSIDATRNGVAAVRADGTVWEWGDNGSGALGLDSVSFTVVTPSHLQPLGEAAAFSLGYTSSLAVGRNLPLSIVPQSPVSTVGTEVRFQLDNTGGNPFYNWAVTGLPPGLRLAAGSGLVLGTPTMSGQFTVVLNLTDGSSPVQRAPQATMTWVVKSTTAVVPNVVQSSEDSAIGRLNGAGFSVQETFFVDRSCRFIGSVRSQSPAGGTVALVGSTVRIDVGLDPNRPCP
jgi:hypothetical protein